MKIEKLNITSADVWCFECTILKTKFYVCRKDDVWYLYFKNIPILDENLCNDIEICYQRELKN